MTPIPEYYFKQFTAFNTKEQRLIIISNDTSVIIMPIYYATTNLSQLPEFLVKQGRDLFMPTDLIAESLDSSLCKMLPFIYSVSGRDIMSLFFFIGKKELAY